MGADCREGQRGVRADGDAALEAPNAIGRAGSLRRAQALAVQGVSRLTISREPRAPLSDFSFRARSIRRFTLAAFRREISPLRPLRRIRRPGRCEPGSQDRWLPPAPSNVTGVPRANREGYISTPLNGAFCSRSGHWSTERIVSYNNAETRSARPSGEVAAQQIAKSLHLVGELALEARDHRWWRLRPRNNASIDAP
jgi:hypothetical protein